MIIFIVCVSFLALPTLFLFGTYKAGHKAIRKLLTLTREQCAVSVITPIFLVVIIIIIVLVLVIVIIIVI